MTYVAVKDLPEVAQRALRAVDYNRKDISIIGQEEVSLQIAGGAGSRGFVILVNFETNDFQVHWGSWGGANMFNQNNPVDLDNRSHKLPLNGAVISGSRSDTTFATLYVNPNNLPKYLPPAVDLTEKERNIMYAYGALRPGNYRKEHLSRVGATNADIQSLVDRGFLKKDGRGITITLAGKNTRKSHAGSSQW